MHYRLTVTLPDGTVNTYSSRIKHEANVWYRNFKLQDPTPTRLSLHRIDGDNAYRLADWQRDRNTTHTREVLTPTA